MSEYSAVPASRERSAASVPDGRSRLRRMLTRLPTMLWLVVMWVILWGDLSPGTVVAGAGVALLCYPLAKLPHIPVRLGFRPLHALWLFVHIAFDLITSSIQVGLHVLWRPEQTRGAIVEVPMRTDSDFLLVMVGTGLSLITGSLVVELDRERGVMYVHGIPIESAESVEGLRRQIRRTEELFVRAFGTSEDMAQFRAAEEEFARMDEDARKKGEAP